MEQPRGATGQRLHALEKVKLLILSNVALASQCILEISLCLHYSCFNSFNLIYPRCIKILSNIITNIKRSTNFRHIKLHNLSGFYIVSIKMLSRAEIY